MPFCGLTSGDSCCFYEFEECCRELAGKAAMSPKSFLLTLGIFCGGYVSNTLLDGAVEAAEKYFHLHTSTYKTDSDGYIICSPEKAKITNADMKPLSLSASREGL